VILSDNGRQLQNTATGLKIAQKTKTGGDGLWRSAVENKTF